MTLVGIAIGTLSAGLFPLANSWLSFRREDRLKRRRDQREALREVNLAVEKYYMAMQALWPSALKAFVDGKVPDLNLSTDKSSPTDIEFQLGLYAPELLKEFKEISDAIGVFGTDWWKSLVGSVTNERKAEQLITVTASFQKITESVAVFRQKLIAYARTNCS